MPLPRWLRSGFALAAAAWPVAAAGQIDVLSVDVALVLGGTAFLDEELAADTGAGTFPLLFAALPEGAEIDAYELFEDAHYFSLATTTLVAGIPVGPADVVRFDGTTYSLDYDASAEGVPEGANVDALGYFRSGTFVFRLLSFDGDVSQTPLVGPVRTADDDDIVTWQGLLFDFAPAPDIGALAGNEVDVDGLHFDGSGAFWFSFDASGTIGGAHFDDEDIVQYVISTGTWSVVYDGSAQHADLASGDVIAVPEPGVAAAFASGASLLSLLAVRRRRASKES